MDSYHRLVNEQDRRKVDCYDQNRDLNTDLFRHFTESPKIGSNVQGIIFIHLLVSNMLVNFDNGVIPASLTELKNDLELTHTLAGVLGAGVLLGHIIGTILAKQTFHGWNVKTLITFSLLLNGIVQLGFISTRDFRILIIIRILTGVFAVGIRLDTFYPITRKKFLQVMIQLTTPLGMTLGYLFSGIIKVHMSWQWGFYIQSCLLLLSSMLFGCYSSKSFKVISNRKDQMGFEYIQSIASSFHTGNFCPTVETPFFPNIGETGNSHLTETKKDSSYFEHMSSSEKLRFVFKNKIFVLMTLSVCSFYFILSGFLFWGTDYMIDILDIEPNHAYTACGLICIASLWLGVFISQILLKGIGGYDSPGIYSIMCLLGFVGCIIGMPIPYFDFESDKYKLISFIWLFLFVVGIMLPIIEGMTLYGVPKEMKTYCSTFVFLAKNILGNIPSIVILGLLRDSEYFDETFGMKVLFSVIILVNLFLQVALMLQSKDSKEVDTNELDSESEVSHREPLIGPSRLLSQKANISVNLSVNSFVNIDKDHSRSEKK